MFSTVKSKLILFFTIDLVLILGFFGSLFAITPSNFWSPKIDHSHFRLQYVFEGKNEDFGSSQYQQDYLKDVCDGSLSKSPIHFHDDRNQLVHLHWQRITGGEVLKYYGVNKIGGLDDLMGVKLDDLLQYKYTTIPIHGKNLPQPKEGDQFWVYSGDEKGFEKREFNDFLNQDLETFLNKGSKIRLQFEEAANESKNSFNLLSVKVNAHSETPAASISQDAGSLPTPEELKDINNLLGNIVIFVQSDEPSNEQVQSKFANLEPLSNSVCGG
jgi:hypothetical protein